jgi:hypothetical protein
MIITLLLRAIGMRGSLVLLKQKSSAGLSTQFDKPAEK